MVDLYIRENDEPAHRRWFDTDLISIGRLAENTLVLNNDQVSRRHAVLERYDTGWVVIDRGSNNGTFLDGSRVAAEEPTRIEPGALLRIGPFAISFASPPVEDLLPDPSGDDPTIAGPEASGGPSPAAILDELNATYAALTERPAPERMAELQARLGQHRANLGDQRFAELLHELMARIAPDHTATTAADHRPSVTEELYVAGHRTLAQLSAELLGTSESFGSVEEVTRFGELLVVFVKAASTWIERCSGVRSSVVESFGTELARMRGDHDPIDTIHTANEVARFALDWRDATKRGDDVAGKLANIFRTFVAQHAAVLRGAREAAEAVMLALSPAAVERRARANASWLGAATIGGAKASPLWTTFANEWSRLSEPGRIELEFVGPKMKEAFRRMDAAQEMPSSNELTDSQA